MPPHLHPSRSPHPGGTEFTPEPGGWAWPCTDFSCILREKGRVQDTWSPAPPFLGQQPSIFPCASPPPPPPRCQIAISSSWNRSVASQGSRFPGQAWECQGGEVSFGGLAAEPLVLGKGNISHQRARPCPAQGHTWKPCTNIANSASLRPHPQFSKVLTGGQNFTTTHLFGDQGCPAGSLLPK